MTLGRRIQANLRASISRRSRERTRMSEAMKARKRQRELLAHNPECRPDEKTLREIRSYAQDVFGHVEHGDWLIAYTMFRGEFVPGWLSQSYLLAEILPTWPDHGRLRARTMQRRVLKTDRFPDRVVKMNGHYLTELGEPLSIDDVKEYAFNGKDRVVVKIDRSKAGEGVTIVAKEGFRTEDLPQEDLVIQSFVEPHPVLRRIMPAAPATIRLITVKPDLGPAQIRNACLRVGYKVGVAGLGLTVKTTIDDDTGSIGADGTDAKWAPIDRFHPDAPPFGGSVVPKYKEMRELCKTLHDRCPATNLIAWDLTVDENEEIQIFEWNLARVSITYQEATAGPIFTGLGWFPDP